jgi:hypothetical protein
MTPMTPKGLLITLVVLLVGQLLPQELYAWCPTVAGWLLRLAARLVPAPHRARYEQEWLAGLEAWDGRNLAALGHALCVLVFAPSLWLRLRGSAPATQEGRLGGRRQHVPRADVPPGRSRLVAGLAVLTAILVAAWLAVDLGGAKLSGVVDHTAQAAAALGAGVACFSASRRKPSGLGRVGTLAVRSGWGLVGAGALVWGVAKLAWTFDALVLLKPHPFLQADAGYLAAIPLLATGVLAFPIAAGRLAAGIRALLDALIIAASLVAVSWVAAFGPLLEPARQFYWRGAVPVFLPWQLVMLAQPIFGVLVATVALSLLARTRRREPAPTNVLAVALLALTVAGSGYVHLVRWMGEMTREMNGGPMAAHHSLDLIDFGVLCSWLLILTATVRPITPQQDWDERQPPVRDILPYALLALAILTVITVMFSGQGPDGFLLLDSIVLVALGLVRSLLTRIENRRRNRRLALRIEELSEREAQLEQALTAEQQAVEELRIRIRELEAGRGGQAV